MTLVISILLVFEAIVTAGVDVVSIVVLMMPSLSLVVDCSLVGVVVSIGVVVSDDVDASMFFVAKEVSIEVDCSLLVLGAVVSIKLSIEVDVSVLDKVLSDDSLLANVVGDSVEVSVLVMAGFSVDVDNSLAVVVVGLMVGNCTPNLLSYS